MTQILGQPCEFQVDCQEPWCTVVHTGTAEAEALQTDEPQRRWTSTLDTDGRTTDKAEALKSLAFTVKKDAPPPPSRFLTEPEEQRALWEDSVGSALWGTQEFTVDVPVLALAAGLVGALLPLLLFRRLQTYLRAHRAPGGLLTALRARCGRVRAAVAALGVGLRARAREVYGVLSENNVEGVDAFSAVRDDADQTAALFEGSAGAAGGGAAAAPAPRAAPAGRQRAAAARTAPSAAPAPAEAAPQARLATVSMTTCSVCFEAYASNPPGSHGQ